MSKLSWDQTGERLYETGVDRGVVFPMLSGAYQKGAAWNGLRTVSESPSGAEPTKLYADNINYLTMYSAEDFGATIGAYTYPDEFAVCDGVAEPSGGVMAGQQTRRPFGFSYRTMIGNDTDDLDYGYKIHLIYNCRVSPSERSNETVNDSPAANELSWTVTTTPTVLSSIDPNTGKVYKPTAHIWIESTKVSAAKLKAFEDIIYGTEITDSRLPLPDEVFEFFAEESNPLSALSVDASIGASFDLHGKVVNDLQSDIVIGESAITGTLKYVDDYTGYSDDPEEQVGNYIALHADVPAVDNVTLTATITGEDPITLDANKVVVLRVADKATQSIAITASKSGYTDVTKTFGLTGLVCETE